MRILPSDAGLSLLPFPLENAWCAQSSTQHGCLDYTDRRRQSYHPHTRPKIDPSPDPPYPVSKPLSASDVSKNEVAFY